MDHIDILLKDLETQPSRTHNLFKRVLKRVYEENCNKKIDRFLNECSAYLVSITARAKGILRLEGLDEKHVEHLIGLLRLEISTMEKLWEKCPEAKRQCPDSVATYNLQKNILIRLTQL